MSTKEEESVYDPAFLLPLISHLLDPGLVHSLTHTHTHHYNVCIYIPVFCTHCMYCIVLLYVFASLCVAGADGLVECREMVRSGVLSYLLVSLSSHMADTRKAATHCLSRFYAHLRSSTCREKPQVRSALPTPHSSFSMNSNLLLTI